MQAGARQYLVKPFSADELMTAIRRVHQMEERKRPRTGEFSRDDADDSQAPHRKATIKVPAVRGKKASEAAVFAPEAPVEAPPELPYRTPDEATTQQLPVIEPVSAPEEAPEAEADEPVVAAPPERPSIRFKAQNGLITAVFSGKGGVGKSFLAANLAAAMAQSSKDVDVALVDLDLQFGDLAVMFGLEPPGTMADVAKLFPEINAPLIGSYMPVAPGGVRVLAAPLSPELADLVRPEHVRATLNLLKGAFDHVVVDLSSHLNDISLEALDCADRILLVSDLNIPAIKDAKLAYMLFDSLKIPLERVHLVLNRATAPTNVTISQLEAHLHTQVIGTIPSQGKQVLQSIHKAVPVIELYPDSEISQKMRELVLRLVPSARSKRDKSPDGARRKFWGRKSAS
jgi:Flp pilus assembly CpaE family ATPase